MLRPRRHLCVRRRRGIPAGDGFSQVCDPSGLPVARGSGRNCLQDSKVVRLDLEFLVHPVSERIGGLQRRLIRAQVRGEQQIPDIQRQEPESIDPSLVRISSRGGQLFRVAAVADEADTGMLLESQEVEVRRKRIACIVRIEGLGGDVDGVLSNHARR